MKAKRERPTIKIVISGSTGAGKSVIAGGVLDLLKRVGLDVRSDGTDASMKFAAIDALRKIDPLIEISTEVERG